MERAQILKILNEARQSLVRFIVVFALLGLASYYYWEFILRFIQEPLGIPLISYGMSETFLNSIKISLFTGVFFSLPMLFGDLWSIIAPFFTPFSRRYTVPVTLAASTLFYTGAAICYYILLPAGIQFLTGYETEHIKPSISIDSYISFFAAFIFGFGLSFELPLVMLLLGRIGIVTSALLARYRRYAILIIVVASAIITPTPDIFNLALMAGPLYMLYEISILLVFLFGRGKVEQGAL